jgi:hypothetical protein
MILRDQRPSTVKTRGCEQHHGVGELTDIGVARARESDSTGLRDCEHARAGHRLRGGLGFHRVHGDEVPSSLRSKPIATSVVTRRKSTGSDECGSS